MHEITGMTSDALVLAARAELPRGAGLAQRVYRRAFGIGRIDPEYFGASAATGSAWRQAFSFTVPQVVAVQVDDESSGSGDGASKLCLALTDGAQVECVRVPMGRGRSHLCMSTQVGCGMGCAFCQTATMGLQRQMTAGEIVGQVLAARLIASWDVAHVMFMGMGEALDNFDNLLRAMEVLTDRRGLGLSRAHMTVCTAGHVDGLKRLARLRWSHLNLAVSLNAATDAVRDRLMPINRRWPLAELQAALVAYRPRPAFVLAINYCLLPGINDSRADAAAIARFCAPLPRVLLHLIPYNPGSTALTRAPTVEEAEAFVAWLREEGVAVRRRVPKGRSIMAACGQLGGRVTG